MTDPWFCRPRVLGEIGMRLAVSLKDGRKAHWIVCLECNQSVVCLQCGKDRWHLTDLLKAKAHAPSIAAHLEEMFKTLAVFLCPALCNSKLLDRPPAAVLLAMADDASREPVESPRPQRGGKSRKVSS